MSDDADLIDLIDRAALEDLTAEQCAAIRAAAAASAAIRQACLERIGLEERLAATLGRPRVAVDDLLGGDRRVVESRFAGRWLAPLLMLLLAGLVAAVGLRRFGRQVDEVATPRPEPVAVAAADDERDDAANLPAAGAGEPGAGPDPVPPDPEATGSPRAAATPPPVAAPAAVTAPWAKALAGEGPEPSDVDLFRMPDLRTIATPLTRADLETWFAAVPGKPLKFGTNRLSAARLWAQVEGTCRLVPPLRQGTALRLLIANPEALRILAWSGRSGGAIEMDGPPTGWRWCGSALSRPESGGPVESRWLVSTSDGRGPRCGAAMDQGTVGFTGIVELRYADGMLVLSRGEVRLVEVPLPEPPDEILFEGTLLVGGVELVRAVVPPLLPPPPPATTEWRPAELAWEGGGADALEKRPAGGVRLAQHPGKPQAPLLALWKLPPAAAGPREILVRIDDFTPGTGICIAGPDGKPVTVCGFVEPTAGGPPDRKGALFMAWPPDKSPLTGGDPRQLGFAFAPRTVWLRFHAVTDSSGNVLVVSWSGDGKTWARLRQPPAWPPGPVAIGAVGLFAGGHPNRAITLTHLAVAELPGFAKILPRDLVAAVDPALDAAADTKQIDAWKAAILKAAPAGADEGRWLAAAAVRGLATTRTRLATPLCMLAWQHARTLGLSPADQLAVCDDIGRFLGVDEGPPSGIYDVVTRPAAAAGDVAAFRTAWLRMQQAPADMIVARRFGQTVDPLGVPERLLRRLHVTGPAAELRTEAARQRFYANDAGFAAALAKQVDVESPVVFEVANPVQNVANEIAEAVAAAAFEDAQRAMAAYAALGDEATGTLALDPRDPDRLATLPVLVAGMLEDQPAFREFMQGQPAERGRLRLAQLRAIGDAAGMAAATCEFQGTPAAAEAHEWLAMRAVAAGDFAAARRQASAGLGAAAPEVRGRLTTILSIIGALGGGERGAPPQASVAGIPPGEIARVVAASAYASTIASPGKAPPPGGLEAVKRLALGPANQGAPAIDYPESIAHPSFQSPPFFRSRLDWAGEVCSLTAVAGRLLAGNRQEVVAVDPATGGAQWRLPAGPKPALLVRYGLVPMRPVCDARHAYLRRAVDNASPTLAAVRLADGTIAWEVAAPATRTFISDPVVVDGLLQICELVPGVSDQLVLVTLDPDTGTRQRDRVVCGLLPGWQVSRSGRTDPGDCQVAAAGGRLFLTLAGSVVCLTADGHPVWVRRQPWMGPEGNRWWWFQAQAPPLAHDGGLFVVQPGVDAVTAIDAASGRLRWRTPLVRLRRLIGLAGGGDAARLVVESDDGIVAIDPQDGAPRTLLEAGDGPANGWTGVAPNRLLGPAVTTADGLAIVAVHRRRPDTEKTGMLDVALLWLDCGSGHVRHEAVVPALADKPPWVGPMAVTDGRLWLLANPNPRDLRRVLWELAPQPAP